MTAPQFPISVENNLSVEQLIRVEALSLSIQRSHWMEAKDRSVETIITEARRFERFILSGDVR
jgi:hypothetical protein